MNENPPPNPPNPDQPAPQRPQVRVPDHLAQGVYATAMIIPHAREEFVLDFLASHAQPPRMIARVVLTPTHTKRLAAALRENINLYEKNHGPIPAAARQQMARTIARGFRAVARLESPVHRCRRGSFPQTDCGGPRARRQ